MREGQPSVYRVVMAVDIESFSGGHRTEDHRRIVRRRFREALSDAFAAIGQDLSAQFTNDTGDGMVIMTGPDIPERELVDPLAAVLTAELREHNLRNASGAEIRLRMALHHGQVFFDDRGAAGDTILHSVRLVDSAPVRDALRRADGPLALVVSQAFYEGVLRGAAGYERVEVPLKESVAVAWLRVPGAPVSTRLAAVVEHFPGPAALAWPAETVAALTNALLMVPSMADDRMRELVVNELPVDIRVSIPRHPRASTDVRSIVRTVLSRDGGLAALLAAVERVQGDTPELDELHDEVVRILASFEDLAPPPKPFRRREQPVPQPPVAPPASDPAQAESRRSRTGLWTAFVDGLSRSLAVGTMPPRQRGIPPRERILARLHDRYNSLGLPDEASERGAVR